MSRKRILAAVLAIALFFPVASFAQVRHVFRYLEDSGGTQLSAVAKTATFNSETIHTGSYDYVGILLITTSAGGSSPTLDVTVQISEDDGTTWRDTYPRADNTEVQAALGQITGNTATSEFWPNWFYGAATRIGEDTFTPRIRFVFTIGGTTPTFTIKAFFVARTFNVG